MDTGLVVFGTSTDRYSSVVLRSFEYRRVFGYRLLLVGRLSSYREIERSTCVYTVDGEDIRSSGLVNGRLVTDYTPRCRCGVQVNR
jgi:hypothetical protein